MNKTNTSTDNSMDKLVLQAKRLALVEMQVKIAEEIEKINLEEQSLNEDSIPF
jgi:hypothetical protein|tara:strand:- start:77 stop:235 length:159 start_codon:yes stop_codon:yes gene_type:complete